MRAILRDRNHWLRLVWLLFGILIYLGSKDLFLRGYGTGNGEFLGAFSAKWGVGLIAYGLVILGITGFLIYVIIDPTKAENLIQKVESRSDRIRFLSWILAIGLISFPLFLILSPWGWRFDLPNFRIMVLVIFSVFAGIFLPKRNIHWMERATLMILISASLLLIFQRFMDISDYPFATSWSEGNRLWDYSLYFGRDRYVFEDPFTYPSYLTPGRHGLWGLPFLVFSNPSIVVMRTWDVILWIAPYLFLGWAVFSSRYLKLSNIRRWILILWTYLFLSQGPIYAPLVLSGVLLALGYHRKRLWQSLLITGLACFYAGISRWTWMLAPAAWGALWVLFDEEVGQSFWRRIRNPVLIALSGIVGAALSQVFMDVAFPRPEPIYATSLNQPLLWYRLWSSATNPTGVVNGLIYAVGPLFIWLLIMAMRSRRSWDWVKSFAVAGALVAFLAAGLVASVKIGGGSNIHNLDMFLITLVLLLGWTVAEDQFFQNLPRYAWAIFAIILFLPVWNLTRFRVEPEIPEDSAVQEVLSEIRSAITEAAQEGEVLFIDQRQLLTFGEIENVPLVMDYEIKHMMNQAMGHNEGYFEHFRSDLENQRFQLIVSDPLYIVFQGPKIAFGEENDAWVEEVTIPILDNYEPYLKFDKHLIWLLKPKEILEE